MIFIDSNIPMYAAGRVSEQKPRCLDFLRKVQSGQTRAVSSAEVLQEILHHYRAIKRLADGFTVYDAFRALPIRWVDVQPSDADYAREILANKPQLSSRDAVHLAVMQRVGITKIVTYDQDFFGIPGITVFLPE